MGWSLAPHSYLYGSVATEEVEDAPAGLEPVADVLGGARHAGRQVARRRVHAGVVEVGRAVRRRSPGVAKITWSPTDTEPICSCAPVPSAASSSASRWMKRRLRSPPSVCGKRPVVAPARLVQLDEAVDGVRAEVGRLPAHRADRLRAADLAADLVACLLVERGEVVVPGADPVEVDDRADVLLLDVDQPALLGCVVAERRRERRQRPGRRRGSAAGRSRPRAARRDGSGSQQIAREARRDRPARPRASARIVA